MARSWRLRISGASTPTRRIAASLTSSSLAWASASALASSAASSLVNSPLRTPLTNLRHLRQHTIVWENVAKSSAVIGLASSSTSSSSSSIGSPSGPNRLRRRSCASFCRLASCRARSFLRTAYSSASLNPHSLSARLLRSAAALARRNSRTFSSSMRLSSAFLAARSLFANASARA